jgi:hypothetical protein
MVEPLRHPRGGNRHARPNITAPNSDSTGPRHLVARDQRPLRVRPKSAREYSQSAATMMAALEQGASWRFTSAAMLPRKRHCPQRGARGPLDPDQYGAKAVDIVVS